MEALTGTTPGFLIWRVSMKWRTAVDRGLAPLGLTHAQYALLSSLRGVTRAGRRPSQRELADWTGLEAIFVSKLVRTLEGSGLLTRTRNPADSRAVQLDLTARGTALADEAIGVVHRLQQELTAPLGGPEDPRVRELSASLRALLRLDESAR